MGHHSSLTFVDDERGAYELGFPQVEVCLFELLVDDPFHVFTWDQMYRAVYGRVPMTKGDYSCIRVYAWNLRKRLAGYGLGGLIVTRRGVGCSLRKA